MKNYRLSSGFVPLVLFLIVSYFIPFLSELRATEKEAEQMKAVSETSSENGFKLLPNALKNIGVVTGLIKTTSGIHTVPKSALIHSLNQLVVYRFREGWFKLIPIKLVSTKLDQISFLCSDIRAGDEVAIKGGALLRVADMEAFGGGE